MHNASCSTCLRLSELQLRPHQVQKAEQLMCGQLRETGGSCIHGLSQCTTGIERDYLPEATKLRAMLKALPLNQEAQANAMTLIISYQTY